eukprot:364204-Chlamydomonas_euryale.AAC.8
MHPRTNRITSRPHVVSGACVGLVWGLCGLAGKQQQRDAFTSKARHELSVYGCPGLVRGMQESSSSRMDSRTNRVSSAPRSVSKEQTACVALTWKAAMHAYLVASSNTCRSV